MRNAGDITSFRGDYHFLSNFWKAQVRYEGITYPSVEHAYQAAKTLDQIERQRMCLLTAAEVKREGRYLRIRPDWEAIKIDTMRALLQLKFAPGTMARKKLDATAPAQLIEGNWWGDRFWGVHNGQGENWLGRLLMEIRDGG